MPDIIYNKLEIITETKEELQEIKEFLRGPKDDVPIDFNNITPMPRWVYGYSPDVDGIGDKDVEKWGYENTLFGWRNRHWGTTRNAYFDEDIIPSTDNVIYFGTSWTPASQLIEKIAWIFPNAFIRYTFISESVERDYFGISIFKENSIEEIPMEYHSKEYFDLFIELVHNGETPYYLKYNEEIDNYDIDWDEEDDE